MTRVLAFDTSGKALSVAVTENDGDTSRVLFEASENHGLTHSVRLLPLIDEAIQTSGLSLAQVDIIACVVGPGSFTGVRIGVATARAFSQALSIPCAAIDALETLAYGVTAHTNEPTIICPMLDARASQVYGAVFTREDGGITRVMDDEALPLADYVTRVKSISTVRCMKKIVFTGDASLTMRDAIVSAMSDCAYNVSFVSDDSIYPKASVAAALALSKPRVPYDALLPLYLRLPQAERELAAKQC